MIRDVTGMKQAKKKKEIVVAVGVATEKNIALPVTAWKSDNFAEDWFGDALHEARAGKDYNARRREIIFAVCFLESYIFEWARRTVQIDEISRYFPQQPRQKYDPRYRRDLKCKWKEVPKELFEDGKISVDPAVNVSGLGTLLKYRHGLIHAVASRPATDMQPNKTKPFPTKKDLKMLKPGWALKFAVDLVRELHEKIGTQPPDYLTKPSGQEFGHR